MTAIGFALIIFGLVAGEIAPPHGRDWDVSDLFTIVPFLIGLALVAAGACTFLWRFMP